MTIKPHTIKFTHLQDIEDFEIQNWTDEELLENFWVSIKSSEPKIDTSTLDLIVEIDRRGLIFKEWEQNND